MDRMKFMFFFSISSFIGADPSLAGNYTCSAKNLFGDDEVTYSLVVLLPPSQPVLEIQYATTNSVKLKWKQSDDGGTTIQGYTLSSKKGSEDWKTLELSPETLSYTFEDLQCGSTYYMFLIAHNRVGNGSPSHLVTVSTKGGPPQIARDTDLLLVNATTLQINLFAWPNGGCPILQFAVEYRILGADKWFLVSSSVSEEKLYIQELSPGTWYQLRVTAENDAGIVTAEYNLATLTITGARIPFPPHFIEDTNQSNYQYKNSLLIIASIILIIIIVCGIFLWYSVQKKRRRPEEEEQPEEEQVDEKTVERDNRRNCQQVYTSSPVKTGEKLAADDASGMYEISPYATFSVPGNNSRSVTTSTLDYTMQFKTFGHLENEDHNAIIYPKSGDKQNWHHKHRYYNTVDHRIRQQQMRMRGDRTPHQADSESEDTSGSPCNECSGSGGNNYRVPVKHSRDIFRMDSSTESNEVSPMTERRHTPRHVALGAGRRGHDRHERVERSERHRPSSSSSSEDGGHRCVNGKENGERRLSMVVTSLPSGVASSSSSLPLQPPSGFSDSRELSEAECDRDREISSQRTAKLPVELAALLARYQEKKEQERKEFTIHV